NGASLLGLSGIVVKSHGGADAEGFRYAVLRAVQEVEHDLPRRLARELGGAPRHSTSRLGVTGGDDRQ
ncbi:phosphate acyltransferase, partial [Klebsiella quasipneumoniae]|nr:phosphate acyltransferase [Klebsiella quasipneumoniae]